LDHIIYGHSIHGVEFGSDSKKICDSTGFPPLCASVVFWNRGQEAGTGTAEAHARLDGWVNWFN
jgi:hypothetical protein